ncbi:MAG: PIG-L family deacetylase [Anaerolineae bacterium]|jgi:LmbE family N-acetylglucosaminyl deacetylase|nr:PIG-L family deacetylase [Anaerolineae bacterium]
MNIIVIVAHPDEGEIYVGGTSYLLSRLGHRVKFLSLTNGDAGHYSMAPEALAIERRHEAMNAKAVLGLADYEILAYHDQHLDNTAVVRRQVLDRIREWDADIVFSYYPIDGGHIDNMCAGRIVRDAVPALGMIPMPVCLYVRDYFTVGFSYIPDIAIPIDRVWDTKLRACACHKSQVCDAIPYGLGILDEVRSDPDRQRAVIYDNTYAFTRKTPPIALTLRKWFGPARAKTVKYVEAFEIAEFGRQVNDREVMQLFPMLGESGGADVTC